MSKRDIPQKLPIWLQREVSKLVKEGKIEHLGLSRTCDFMNHFRTFRFIDHWGRCGDVFYTEPYTNQEIATENANEFAEFFNCEWRFVESKWFPPHTVRVEFFR